MGMDALVREVGASVVVKSYVGGGDVRNAWDVLVQALGGDKERAQVEVEAEAAKIGEDTAAIFEAIVYNRRAR